MPNDRGVEPQGAEGSSPSPSDEFLVAGMLGGDAAALTRLMDRYDRLIRYTVFRASKDRCVRDPQWLESIASATWTGFVRSMQRDPDNPPKSVRAYLVRIARNQVVSALRSSPPERESLYIHENGDDAPIAARLEEPIEELSRLEHLEALRVCLAELDSDDRTLATQLPAITERRWREAAEALGLKESTLRSRWKRTLERLRGCIERKTGNLVAPRHPGGDS
ncbi:MAG: sigma-70 family RNA polymerase sigma factor [Phycisphaerae bacterium]